MPPSARKIFAFIVAPLALVGATPPMNSQTFIVPLSGAEESEPGATGDPDGYGTLKLSIDLDRKQVCYDFTLSKLATPMMAHIHRAPPHRIGPSVVTLFTGMGSDELVKCIPWTNTRLEEIVAQPSNFYVNVYTTEYPDGALRGQLPAA